MNEIKKRRFELGLTQYDLERLSGIQQSQISLVENGYRTFSWEDKIRVAKALQTETNKIFPTS